MKLFITYLRFIFLLLLYSYTQVDLSLTFSRNEFLQGIVRSFQEIGYFQRPFSAFFYSVLLVGMYIFYGIFLFLAWRGKLTSRFLWKVILVTVGILLFSYSAFSHDIFNYIFDAKIITHYQQNPYEHKALDYPGDPMLSFMHWTHRMYPYGPIWLILTVPISFIGFGYFIPTFFLFKLLVAGSFVGSLYFTHVIARNEATSDEAILIRSASRQGIASLPLVARNDVERKEALALTFFGLQPLLLIESLVSPHLDIVMLFFSLWAFWLLIKKKHILAVVLLFVSIGIKFATVFLLPVFLLVWWLHHKKKKVPWGKVSLFACVLMFCAVGAMTWGRELQPWYLVSALTFAALLSYRFFVLLPTIIISFFLLLIYIPYLYLGSWDAPVPQIRFWITVVGIGLAVGGIGLGYIFEKRRNRI